MKITNRMVFAIGAFLVMTVVLFSLLRTTQKDSAIDYADLIQDPDTNFVDYDYTEVSADIIRKKIRSNPDSVKLIDIRPIGQYSRSHIVNSLNLPAETIISGDVTPNYNVDMVVVVFSDASAELLSKIVKILERQNDYVVVLSGGIQSWESIGAPIISSGDPNSVIDAAKVQYITEEELLEIINKKKNNEDRRYVILDIRPRIQFERDHIPYAINIPLDQIENLYNTLPATKRLIVYGSTARESFRGGVALYDLSFLLTQTLNIGYIDWVRNNNPIE